MAVVKIGVWNLKVITDGTYNYLELIVVKFYKSINKEYYLTCFSKYNSPSITYVMNINPMIESYDTYLMLLRYGHPVVLGRVECHLQ